VAEAIVRLDDVDRRVGAGDIAPLQVISDATQIVGQDPAWFAEEGCYLVSTAYLTAGLFAELVRVHDAYPFLRIRHRARDVDLAVRIQDIQLGFAGIGGVYYAVQLAIGEAMLNPRGKMIGYPSYCAVIAAPDTAPWHRRLLDLYVHAAQPDAHARIRAVLAAMRELATLLDEVIGTGDSLHRRLAAEAAQQAQRAARASSP
jgi:hypothetical protein